MFCFILIVYGLKYYSLIFDLMRSVFDYVLKEGVWYGINYVWNKNLWSKYELDMGIISLYYFNNKVCDIEGFGIKLEIVIDNFFFLMILFKELRLVWCYFCLFLKCLRLIKIF